MAVKAGQDDKVIRAVAENRKARHEYSIDETFEAGISLIGSEVKSCRAGKVNIADSYVIIRGGEMFLFNTHIAAYETASRFDQHEPTRDRKLLVNKSEILKYAEEVSRKGFTLVPLKLYFKQGRLKALIGLAKGKKLYDKRADAAKRDAQREMQRAMKDRQNA